MTATNRYSRQQAEAYLAQVPQAWVAVGWHGDPQLIAAPFAWQPGASRVRLPRCVARHLPHIPFPAAVCVDEGRWFFDLRGVHLKGTLTFREHDGDDAVYTFAEERLRGWDSRFFVHATAEPAAPGPDAPLSRDARHSEDVIRVATLSRAGRPHITPIWYHHTYARYAMQTAEGSKLVTNIRENPRVAAAISHPHSDRFYPATYLIGTASFARRNLRQVPTNVAISTRYFFNPTAVRHALTYRDGVRHIPAHFSRRPNPGVVTLDVAVTTEVYSPEGVAGEWLVCAEPSFQAT